MTLYYIIKLFVVSIVIIVVGVITDTANAKLLK